MTKTELVQQEMFAAMKNKDTERKAALSMLLSALKAKAKDKQSPLTEDEENEVIRKEIKQTIETWESAPETREDIIEDCKLRVAVMSEFASKSMPETEIRSAILKVIRELKLEKPAPKDKGAVMKSLMPLVKGKADGSLVNKLVSEILSGSN